MPVVTHTEPAKGVLVPGMPAKVLLAGDSITGALDGSWAHGYAELAAQALAGEADVAALPQNGEDSTRLLAQLAGLLHGGPYAVVHFNCGLHDIKRAFGAASAQVPLSDYEANLRRLVELLQPQAQTLIWASITPVEDGQPAAEKPFNRFNRDVDAYNAVAVKVMAAYGIAVNDLHAVVRAAGVAACLSPDGVHMTPAGNRLLADRVVAAVRTALRE